MEATARGTTMRLASAQSFPVFAEAEGLQPIVGIALCSLAFLSNRSAPRGSDH